MRKLHSFRSEIIFLVLPAKMLVSVQEHRLPLSKTLEIATQIHGSQHAGQVLFRTLPLSLFCNYAPWF